MCNPNPYQSKAHAVALELARGISDHLTPATGAYREIWLDGEKIAGGVDEDTVEPIYGKTYLPRKFKIVVAVPPSNDVDIFAHDLGFIAILDDGGNVTGWNVTVGGGMGMTHGELDTYPRTADIARLLPHARRDRDRRTGRHRAARLGRPHQPQARAAEVHHRGSRTRCLPRRGGEARGREARSAAPVHVHVDRRPLRLDRGRQRQRAPHPLHRERPRRRTRRAAPRMLTGLRKIAEVHKGDIRLTANQNIIIANVTPGRARHRRGAGRRSYQPRGQPISGLRRNAMACVALPTCGLALAESRALLCPSCSRRSTSGWPAYGLTDDDIVIRMTGCPNGCARPYLAEIGLVGKGPGRYNLYLGAPFDSSRLSKLYAEDLRARRPSSRALDPLVRRLCQGPRERRALRRFRDPRGLCRAAPATARISTEHGRAGVSLRGFKQEAVLPKRQFPPLLG